MSRLEGSRWRLRRAREMLLAMRAKMYARRLWYSTSGEYGSRSMISSMASPAASKYKSTTDTAPPARCPRWDFEAYRDLFEPARRIHMHPSRQ
jgi:hypothetical protein